MSQKQYKFIGVPHTARSSDELTRQLNNEAKEGWQLLPFFIQGSKVGNGYELGPGFMMERELEASDDKKSD